MARWATKTLPADITFVSSVIYSFFAASANSISNSISVSRALKIWFISSKVTACKYWVSGITCHMYSREERTRLTGEINDMSAFIPGA